MDTPRSTWKHTFASLRDRDFRFLWFGVVAMMSGLQMQGVARGYLTYELTSSPFLLGLVSVGFAVPMLLLSLFGGVVADRFERRRIIQISQALGAATAFAIGASIATSTITWVHLLVSSLINGVIFAFMVPSRTALIPQLVGREMVTNALALNAAAMSGTTLLAPAIAGNLYNLLGPAGVYFTICAVEVLSVIFTGRIRKIESVHKRPSSAMIRDIGDGLRHIWGNRPVLVLLVFGLSITLLAMPFRTLLPVFVVDIYHRGPEGLGLLVSAMGVGALVGSLAVAAVGNRHRGVLLIAGGIMSGASLLVVSCVPVYIAGAVIMVFLGLGDSLRRSLNQAMILELVEEDYRGRVSSVYAMNFGLMPLAVLPAGIVAEHFGSRVAVAGLAVPLLVICFVVLATQKELRRMM